MQARALMARLERPADGAGLAAFRAMFGALMLLSTIRFWVYGWIDEIIINPPYHFTYAGFRWVRPLPGGGSYLHFAVMAAAAAAIMLGYRVRLSALIFFVLFSWAELIEKAAYLNHYYLVSILALFMAVLPTSANLAWRPHPAHKTVGIWTYWLLRAQIAIVYLHASIAKINGDWLLRGEPLHTWLQAYAHLPLIGGPLTSGWAAVGMSWVGMVFDLTIWLWLLRASTRRAAYLFAVGFHLITWLLFPIGVFPWVMLLAITVFFDPSWPRRLGRWPMAPSSQQLAEGEPGRAVSRAGMVAAGLWLSVQLLVPLRHVLYAGSTNWTEEGFRFAWRVMLVEKTGQLEYRVRVDGQPHLRRVYPRQQLTPLQYRMLCTQFDMMVEYAHELARQQQAAGHAQVQVYADAFVSFNGRPSQRAVDPTVDLAAEPMFRWATTQWILPLDRP